MIILRSPKGWTGPKEVDGIPIEGTFRAHQVPLATVRENPHHLQLLEAWMKSYQPEKLFDAEGKFIPELAGARAARQSAHGRQSQRERRPRAQRAFASRLRQLRSGSPRARTA